VTRKQIEKLLEGCEVQSGSKGYWFKVEEEGLAGGIAKFANPVKEALTERLGLEPGMLVVVAAGSHIIIATGPHQVVHPMHAGPAKLGVRAYHRLIHLGSLGVIYLRTGNLVLGIYLQKRATDRHKDQRRKGKKNR
jgi:hypothetical protein